jgi:hypothetical protein
MTGLETQWEQSMIAKVISKKTEGWEQRLDKLLDERAERPFKWGSNDCCVFTCDAIKEMTGKDPGGGWGRGTYTTQLGAFKQMKKYSGVGFLNTFSAIFKEMGFEEINNVQYGDIAFVRIQMVDQQQENLLFGGVTLVTGYNDVGAVVAQGEDGLLLVESYELVKAWRL